MLIPTPTQVNIEHGAAVLERAFHKNTGHYKPVIHAHTLTYKSADDKNCYRCAGHVSTQRRRNAYANADTHMRTSTPPQINRRRGCRAETSVSQRLVYKY